jgi:hypothetical protein
VPPPDGDWRAFLAASYLSAGFRIVGARRVGLDRLDRWPSSWARRLAHGGARPFVEIEARAVAPAEGSGAEAGRPEGYPITSR